MDRKTILGLLGAFALLYLWMWAVGKMYPPVPAPPPPSSGDVATGDAAPTAVRQPAPAVPTDIPPLVTPEARTAPDAPEETATLETPDAIYTFTSLGGGLKQIALKKYFETVRADRIPGSNEWVKLNDRSRVPVLAMQMDAIFSDNAFTLTTTRSNSVIAEKTWPTGLRIVKEFLPASNHVVSARVWIENTSDQPLVVPSHQLGVGTATPAGLEDNIDMLGVFWFNGEKAEHIQQRWFDNRALGCLWSTPRSEYVSGQSTVWWGAVHSQFFALAVIPATNAIPTQFTTRPVELPRQVVATNGAVVKPQRGFEALLMYPGLTLAPGQFVERQFTIYAGPKQEKTLARLGRQLDEIMDFGWFSPISKIFLRAMNRLSRWMPYGMAIIVITVIIKLVFWPLTQASTRSMKRMQALAPEMKKIQTKYKDDPAKMNKKVMEFWREHKVSPMSGCWPMLVQLPIFFALFRMIPNAIELRGTNFLWIHDLSRPDTIFYIPGVDFPFNPLPLIMGATMLWQARLTPPAATMDPAQQAMMKYMPLIFLVFLYNQPAGLTLYWTVQNLLSIVQTKLTKAKDEKTAPAPAPAPAVVAPAKKKK